jgi:hypothetical protein
VSDSVQALPQPPDYELAKSLYANGLSLAECAKKICVKLDTLYKYANRHQWKEVKAALSERVGKAASKELGTASEQVRTALADHLQQSVAVLSKSKPPASYKAIKEQQSALAPLVQNAKTVFGWGESGTTNTYNFALIDSTKTVEPVQSQVIEAETVTVEPVK